ncbi:hypothetical protein [Streptomyces sp. SID161]|uniref:hypothetical protein n=1 Tax=Streptomyces sp. SID161 TaxID=2690251 RepID=UPI00136ED9EF|nr:hypothetical protein [Streptomyces sp. SID161]MYW48876.1 hypothetical protein [Streptomyces sp. SID161]MYW49839.1 hypothetical protein [Streptomyces sp. SID161]
MKFNSDKTEEDGRFEDGEGREYRYSIGDNGALLIWEKEAGGHIAKKAEPFVIYGPAAWFSVVGDARSSHDDPPARVRGF